MGERIIAIDAGHGSETAGKRTPDGYREHYANTVVANYLYDLLKNSGFSCIRTGFDDADGTNDIDTSLASRQQAIKAAGCEVSVSIHFNASGDGTSYNDASGIETYIHSTNPNDSKELATLVQAQLVQGTTQKNRGIKSAAFAMVNCSTMNTKASILCELGFMTNQVEATLMQDKDFCKECAREIAAGIGSYYGIAISATPAAVPEATTENHNMTKEQFIEFVGAVARRDWIANRIMLPSVVVAQAVKESASGTSELAQNANALCGVKLNGWTGKSYLKVATEQRTDGTYYNEDNTLWRAYESWEAGILDHNQYIATRRIGNQTEPNWKAVIGETDYNKVVHALQSAEHPYATSLSYEQSLIKDFIIKYDLTRFDVFEEDVVLPEDSETLFRVQVGAYRHKSNAQIKLESVKAAGFDAIIIQI